MQYDYIAHLDPTREENKFLWDALGINSSDFKMRWSNGKLIRHILNSNLIVLGGKKYILNQVSRLV